MIRPPGRDGVAFTDAAEGDMRHDLVARVALARSENMPENWATVDQVHGNHVVRVDGPAEAGPADALWTTEPDLAVAVFTADCFGVVLHAPGAVGVAHAGWRGARAGVISRLRQEMSEAGHDPTHAAVGPGIGPCCFEVGPEVLDQFTDDQSSTTWGAASVDLRSFAAGDLEGLQTWFSGACTRHDEGFFSHREDGTARRMAALGWIP